MRSTISIILLLAILSVKAEEFIVFEKEGYYGVKNADGQITVPPVYEKLGWSNGEDEVFQGVIGYKKGNNWGLITVRNKSLTEQKFFSLEPFDSDHLKASIKGRFSNHLFYGLLDIKGRTTTSFNYFDLSKLGNALLVSTFSNSKQQFGLVSYENEILIPLKYQKIEFEKNFQLAYTFSHTIDIYHNSVLVQSSLDSIRFQSGIIGYNAGYSGHIDEDGRVDKDFTFKEIRFENGTSTAKKFPTWRVYDDHQVLFEQQCDSLNKTDNNIWIAYLNGAQHIVLPEADSFEAKDYIIKRVEHDFAIIQHSKNRKFSVVNVSGKFLVTGYDSITFSETHFLGLKKDRWDIINSSGTKIHRFPFTKVLPGPRNFFIAMKNDHWGVVDFNGDNYITFKYDSIIHRKNHYEVKYLNKWGAFDFHGNWIVQPDYTSIQSFNEVIIGQRGLGYSVHHSSKLKFKTTYKPVTSIGEDILIEDDSSQLGLINHQGELVIIPSFNRIVDRGNFIELKRGGYSRLMSNEGETILSESDQIESIGTQHGSYLPIKKNGRWGFVDLKGKLLISNRYDSVHLFNAGLAAIQLKNKWGFINTDEKLVVQPYYDNASTFQSDLAIVSSDNLYGMITPEGKVEVELSFKKIERLHTKNYRVTDQNGRVGLIDSSGKFLLRPAYDYVEDTGKGMIVSQNGLWGYLEYSGGQIFNLEYSQIKMIENLLLLKI